MTDKAVSSDGQGADVCLYGAQKVHENERDRGEEGRGDAKRRQAG